MKNSFPEFLTRLKHELRVSRDSEVAEALGISRTAFAERKKRGSFPEREVVQLAAKRPDLGVDIAYVLTGERVSASAKQVLQQTAGAVYAAEPDAGHLTDEVGVAARKHGDVRRRPEYRALMEILDYLHPEDLTVLTQLAVRMVRGPVAGRVPA